MEQGDRKAMKKAQKEQAEKIIRLLEQVHSGIKKAVERGQSETAMELLSQCQESAIELGESIEEVEGEGFVTVSLLENYCEAVYQAYTQISQVKGVNALKVQKNLGKALVCVSNSIKNDIKIRKEVVFLPYKACMWDSLESVWKAAEEDEDCDVYVIPIPYYDKNPDGSFREMHYEGEQYPDYVPVTWYEDYDFGEHQPDVIFIHNPYDECNYVTSVHPFFYSKNIKRFTEKLVYVPYFILEEPEPEKKESVEGMAHFCTLPGVIHADRVIVQSENMRRVYIDVMTEFTAKSGKVNKSDNQRYWEKKILGLGSPKVDKILNTKKEDLEIPKEWMKWIEKPDGSWKKVVLYNTSVTALLENADKMLEKMEYVFRIFKEYQGEIVLLWRPHPLIKATIESMRPQLWNKYSCLLQKYYEEGWGIYDDTADLDRAIEISDAYYGDASSVIQLCQEKNKPVMLQSMSCNQFDWNGLFYTYKLVESKGKIWFVTALFNGLFVLDIKTGEIEWKGKIPYERDDGDNLFRDYLAVDEKIYFAPTNAENIVIYDIAEKEYKKISFNVEQYEKNQNYASIIEHGKELIFIGINRTNAICKLQIDTRKITYIELKAIEKIEKKTTEELYGFKHCIRENILYIPLMTGGCALKVDLSTEKSQLLHLAEEKKTSFTMAIYIPDKDVIWFINQQGNAVQWDEKTQMREEILFTEHKDKEIKKYTTYKLEQEKLFLFPINLAMECRCIHIPTNKCTTFFSENFRILDTFLLNGNAYYLGNKKDGKIYIKNRNGEGEDNEVVIHRKDYKIEQLCFDEYEINFFAKKASLYWESHLNYQYGRSLYAYIQWIVSDLDADRKGAENKTLNIGKIIWDYQFKPVHT